MQEGVNERRRTAMSKYRIELALFREDEERDEELVHVSLDADILKTIFTGFDLRSFAANLGKVGGMLDDVEKKLWLEKEETRKADYYATVVPVKRKGGWPKGKPRKPRK